MNLRRTRGRAAGAGRDTSGLACQVQSEGAATESPCEQNKRKSLWRPPDLPDFGVGPVPISLRRFRLHDHIVLWGSLNVGLLALVAGSFVVPGLGLPTAVGALAVGASLGALILGVIAALAATTHLPGMMLMRAPLGVQGSIAPSILNAMQNVGFAVFEIVIVAAALRAALGGGEKIWVAIVTVISVLLVLAGPLAVVRRVLRVIAVPLVISASVWLAVWTTSRIDWSGAVQGRGGFTFWQAVDLAVAGMLSWAPLVPDYARFGCASRSALAGTAIGSYLPALSFFSLGAALTLAGGADSSVGFKPAVGAAALIALAVAEIDKPFANLYSTVISIQNIRPRWPAPLLGLLFGGFALAIALTISLSRFQTFLFLIGSCFVPLAGVLLGHAARARPIQVAELLHRDGRYGRVRFGGFAAWLLGFVLYQWIAPTTLTGWRETLEHVSAFVRVPLSPPGLSSAGASLPSFAVAFVASALLTKPRQPRPEGDT
jgi:nucleobase:cation symporter-1, NCS1 family